MALFGPRDKDLPRLTRFYQVSQPGQDQPMEEWELYEWLRREIGHPLPFFYEEDRAVLDRLRRIHLLVRQMMDELADNHKLRMTTARAYLEMLKEIPEPKRDDRFIGLIRTPRDAEGYYVEGYEPGEWIEPTDLVTMNVYHLSWDHDMGKHILADIYREKDRPELFTRCEECLSAFRTTRAGQVYCSKRCSGRVMTRRSRQKKDSDVMPKVENNILHGVE